MSFKAALLTRNPELVPILDRGFGGEGPGGGHACLQSPLVRVGVVGVALFVAVARGTLAPAHPRLVLEPEPDRVRHGVGVGRRLPAGVARVGEVNELHVVQELAVVAADHHEDVESC